MKSKFKKTFFLLLYIFCLIHEVCLAESLFIKGKKNKNAYVLRWAPVSEELWNIAKQKGFVLERYTFCTANNFSDVSDVVKIKIQAPLSRDTSFWRQYEQDDYTMLLGQSLFGETFDIQWQSPDSLPWEAVKERRDQDLSRFHLAMLAADRSFKTACIAGLAYRDTNVKNQISYLYRLYIDSDSLKQDTAILFRTMDDYEVLPPLEKIQAVSFGRKVALRWDTKILSSKYAAYFVERSKNGNLFELCHTKPLVKWNHIGKEDNTMFYEDSMPYASSFCFYRLKALDIFGDEYVVSEPLKVELRKVLSSQPEIDSVQELANADVKVFWSMNPGDEEQMDFLALWTKSAMYGSSREIIRQKTRTKYFLIKSADIKSANYFFIRSRSLNGEEFTSKNVLFLRTDSTPPLPPENLRAFADSSGKICIDWDASISDDVATYHIYLSFGDKKAFVRITEKGVDLTSFFDSVSMQVYGLRFYKVKAVDYFGNESEFSTTLSVKPFRAKVYSPPILETCDYDAKQGRVLIKYCLDPGFSGNSFLRVRINGKDQEHILMKNSAVREVFSYEYFCKQEAEYEFSVYLINQKKDSLPSVNTFKVKHALKRLAPGLRSAVYREKALLSIEWKPLNDAAFYYLYKREKGGTFFLAGKLKAEQSMYADTALRMNTVYEYVIQVEFKDGSLSDYSKTVSVMY